MIYEIDQGRLLRGRYINFVCEVVYIYNVIPIKKQRQSKKRDT